MVKTRLRAIVGVLALGLLSLPASGQAETPITIAMTADRWQVKENAEFLRQLGIVHG
jgi:hypothetical protein